jgi:hypothetical protein
VGDSDVDWKGAMRLRGEVMLRAVFHIAARCAPSLSSDSWLIITQLLVSENFSYH